MWTKERKRKYRKEYYKKHRKQILKRQKELRDTDEYREKCREYYQRKKKENPEHYKEMLRRQRERSKLNREKNFQRNKEWYEKWRQIVYSLIGNSCFLCGSRDKIEFHEKNFRKHPNSLKYIAEHSEDFVPLCKRHHEAIHRLHSISLDEILYLLKYNKENQ